MRNQVLKDKQAELERSLRNWAAKNNILSAGEQLSFELRIIKVVPTVVGRFVDEIEETRRVPLPPDEPISGGCRRIWELSEEDWDKLNKLPWNSNQLLFLTMLCTSGNGPLHYREAIDKGVEWPNGGFVKHFNGVLKVLDDHDKNKVNGAFYKLFKVSKVSGAYPVGYYSIMKHQRCPEAL